MKKFKFIKNTIYKRPYSHGGQTYKIWMTRATHTNWYPLAANMTSNISQSIKAMLAKLIMWAVCSCQRLYVVVKGCM